MPAQTVRSLGAVGDGQTEGFDRFAFAGDGEVVGRASLPAATCPSPLPGR